MSFLLEKLAKHQCVRGIAISSRTQGSCSVIGTRKHSVGSLGDFMFTRVDREDG